MYDNNTLLIVGQAKPSREDAIYTLHGEFYISLVVEKESGKILILSAIPFFAVTRNFVADPFIGKSIKTDLEELEKTLKSGICPDAKTVDCLYERRP